jgi:chromosome segregation ATPase
MNPLHQASERLTRASFSLATTKQDLHEAIKECQNLKLKVKGAREGQRAQLRKEIAEAEEGIAEAEVEVAKAEVEVAKAEVEVAKAKLKGAPEGQRAQLRKEIAEAEEDLVKARANFVDTSGQ